MSARNEMAEEMAEEGGEEGGERPTPRRRTVTDPLYGALPIARWAHALTETPPFVRLAHVSLSDVPGELLVRHPFPSRLAHSRGVYALARWARPRDRALHAAALAHDLGHGPFSHLTEPLMIERLGLNHEQRGAQALRQALTALRGPSARLLAWLDPDEVAALMLGAGPDGRGALLNGLLDYDNLDNVARFLQAADLGAPSYDPRALARELRLLAPEAADGAPDSPELLMGQVALTPHVAPLAQAWLADRRRVYRYLGQGERNLALHGMLRKAVDLAAQSGLLGDDFFDATDAQALWLLRSGGSPAALALAEAIVRDRLYLVAWEASLPARLADHPDPADAGGAALAALFGQWRTRLALEEQVAREAGLAPHEVALSYTIARGERALPPTVGVGAGERGRAQPAHSAPLAGFAGSAGAAGAAPLTPERSVFLLIAPTVGRDYLRRARMAAERALASFGLTPRRWADLR